MRLPFRSVVFDSIAAVRLTLPVRNGADIAKFRRSSRRNRCGHNELKSIPSGGALAFRWKQRRRFSASTTPPPSSKLKRCVATGGERGVLCADGHKGYAQPIGGVVAYKDKISLSGVGFDIACGNLAILTDGKREGHRAEDRQESWTTCAGNFVRDRAQSKTRVEHELFEDPAWKLKPIVI